MTPSLVFHLQEYDGNRNSSFLPKKHSRAFPGEYEDKGRYSNLAQGSAGSDYSEDDVRGNASVSPNSSSSSSTQARITGRGFIIASTPHGGVIEATDGTIVTFGPRCAFLDGDPVCHSYFGKGTKVNFAAMFGKVTCTATKIWQ